MYLLHALYTIEMGGNTFKIMYVFIGICVIFVFLIYALVLCIQEIENALFRNRAKEFF
jgi:hypothetical protein